MGLRTTDYEASIAWYIEKLGFRLLKKWTAGELKMAFLAPANDDSFWIELLNGGIGETKQDPSQPIISGYQHLCIAVAHVDETLAEMRERGVNVIREPFDVPAIGKRCGFIVDLFGNVIEFAEDIG